MDVGKIYPNQGVFKMGKVSQNIAIPESGYPRISLSQRYRRLLSRLSLPYALFMAIFSLPFHGAFQSLGLRLKPLLMTPLRALGTQLKLYGDRLRAAEGLGLILALAIGASTGLTVVAFHYCYNFINHLSHGPVSSFLSSAGYWTMALIPALGGLIVGLMRRRWQDFGPGITSLKEAEAGDLQTWPKLFGAAISLGTGASLGPEGPSVEIGARLGVRLGKKLRVSQERLGLMLSAGVAAGLAAGFNAPVAGVFLALEVFMAGTFSSTSVSLVLLAAVVSAWLAQMGIGAQPALALPTYEVRSPLELPLYIGLGVLASGVSIAFTQSTQFAQRSFRGEGGWTQLARIPRWLQPMVGGAVVGILALKFPQLLGVGYETVEAILGNTPFSIVLLISLLGLKLFATSLCLGSGLVGGGFAPAMYLGACLGAVYGQMMANLLPFLPVAAPPAYAMVGMAAVLAGSTRAPLTAILLLFEMTRDYRIVLPLMAAVGLSVWLVEKLTTLPSADQAPLEPMGVQMQREPLQEILQMLPVSKAMAQPMPILDAALSIVEAGQALLNHQSRGALMVNCDAEIVGVVTLKDINRALVTAVTADEKTSLRSIGETFAVKLVYAEASEAIATALKRMNSRGLHQIPVLKADVSPEQPITLDQILGSLDQASIDLACGLAIAQAALVEQLDRCEASELPPGLSEKMLDEKILDPAESEAVV